MDLIIIGAGPAGITAGIYAKHYGLEYLIINNPEQTSQTLLATKIENWPGIKEVSGNELLKNMKSQVTIKEETVISIEKGKVKTDKGEYEAKTIIIATGASHRKANIVGESEFLGKGVSYCATCDGTFFKGKSVIVWGGGDTALLSAVHLRSLNVDVTLVHRRKEFRGAEANVQHAKDTGVKFVLERSLKEIKGDKLVTGVVLDDDSEIKCDGVFISIGEVPTTELAKKAGVKLDQGNFIIVDKDMKTNVAGIFAAGDVTNTNLRQIVTACADGARAVLSAYKYIKGN